MKKCIINGAIALSIFAAALGAQATTNYWDNNGATPGFGTAGGTWGIDGNWSGDSSGASIPTVINTTAADELYFGTDTDGLKAGTITVADDTQAFKNMTFGAASGAITLRGGTLNLGAPVAKIASHNPSNTIASVLAGAGELHKGEILNYGEFLTTSAKLLFKNATLADCTAIFGMIGGAAFNKGVPVRANAFNLINNSTNLTCQMQAIDNGNLKCVTIELTQVGADIHGRAVAARYAYGKNLGYDFDTSSYTEVDVATSQNTSSYGIPQLSLSLDAINPTVLTKDESPVTLFTDVTLAQVRRVNGSLCGTTVNSGTPLPGQAFFFVNNGTTTTFQLQAIEGNYTKCVKIELSQAGPDIQGRAIYAKNINRKELGFNFDTDGDSNNYQANNLSYSYITDDSVLALAGANTYSGDTTIANGTLEISGAGSLGAGSYNDDIRNYGTLLFSGNANQILSGGIKGSGSMIVSTSAPTNAATLLTWPGFIPATSALLFTNQNLADYQSAAGWVGGAAVNFGTPLSATVYDFQNNGTSASFQLQAMDKGAIKCAKVELTQNGADIYGQRIYYKIAYNSALPYPDFDTDANGTTKYEAANVTLSTHSTPPSLTLRGENSYSGGTIINFGTIIAQTSRFAISSAGPITINHGGELRLNVIGDSGLGASNPGGVGDGRTILVNSGGCLTFAAGSNAGYKRPITLDGGTLHSSYYSAERNDNYANNITLKNGAQITGNPMQMGHHSDATITVRGTNASTIASGLCLVNSADTLILDVADVTGDSAADLLITGVIRDYDYRYENMPTIKTNAGTVCLSAVNTHKGPYTITQGAILLAGDDTLNTDNDIVLNGGSLEMGAVNNSAGTLALTTNSEMALGTGTIAFKNSSELTWSGTLTLTGTLIEKSVRFGMDNSGLTQVQLDAIHYNNGKSVRLDLDGYLTDSPSGIVIFIQ